MKIEKILDKDKKWKNFYNFIYNKKNERLYKHKNKRLFKAIYKNMNRDRK